MISMYKTLLINLNRMTKESSKGKAVIAFAYCYNKFLS